MSVSRKPRFSLKLQIVYDDGQSYMSGPVLDMSETGVFIETVMPLSPGTKVRLVPLVPEHDGQAFELDGEVVRKADYDHQSDVTRSAGMGVRFTDVSAPAQHAIARLLERGRQKA